jgi:hypothetical protein
LSTHTDKDGQFRLSVQPGAVLIVSHTGYASQQIAVGKHTVIPVLMRLASQKIAKADIGYRLK